ncbi:DUF4190 domain-containing protein [Stackebrandtia nassauensis]|uniref:DUF4190 domain-containing protein n=1 Tax=Stackebrandtia nassauensis (strain DSM 44728 / CIP 108903 / NRRL B-16338 / NBRC 102104 / LLR-40K-21) TaxID=446470 RepID=D3Q9G2_STANL|nr:DUF4190 domain-containing protein [Stackebrandtia nassauensis]ADD42644.1 hypothetical protein Snas_2969 [Stackebrandtia nassauensis DSM 44728]
MTYDPSAQQPDDPYTQYPDSPPPQQPTSGGYYPQQQPGYQQPGYQQPGYQQPGYQQSGYQQPAYQQTPGYMPEQELPQGMPLTSMILGIVSIPLVFCCYIGTITGILAIIFGAIGLSQVNKGEARGKGMAMAGLILGISAFVVLIVFIVLYIAVGASVGYDFNDYNSY